MESSDIDSIKEYIQTNVKIVDLLDTYEMNYKQVSESRLKMCCPFHEESTASMVIYLESNSFHCFGCARNGNAITFLMFHLKKTFSEIMEMYKEKAKLGEALVFEKINRSFQTSAMDVVKYIRSNKYSLGVYLRGLLYENPSRWDEIDRIHMEMDNFFENEDNLDKTTVDEFVGSIMGRVVG